ncbi:MAG: MFS transporter [Eubacteriales bacterium]
MSNGNVKTNVLFSFFAAEMFSFLMLNMGVQYFSYFLTDVAFIAPAIAATILLIAKVIDTVDVPFVGAIVVKTNMRWGKYRSFILVCAPITAVLFSIMFTDFNVGDGTKAIYMAVAYIIAHLAVNHSSTSRLSLISVVASNQKQRIDLAAKRAQGGAFGTILSGAVTLPLIAAISAGNETKGYSLTAMVFAIIMLISFYYQAHCVKEYDIPEKRENRKAVSIKDMLGQIAVNKPLQILMIAEVFRYTLRFTIMGLAMYYFRYVLNNMVLLPAFFTVIAIGSFGGTIIGQYMARFMENKRLYLISLVMIVVSLVGAYLFAQNSAVLFIGLITIAWTGDGMVNTVQAAMYSDVSYYGRFVTGKDVTALVMSLLIFPLKLGVVVGGSVAAYGLALIGYVPDTTAPEVINGIRTIITVFPLVFSIVSVIAILFYSLTKEKVSELQQAVDTGETA